MKNYILISIVAILAGFLIATYIGDKPTGSVGISGEYRARALRTSAGTAITTGTVINTEEGTLGSVVITGAGTGIFHLLDADGTNPGSGTTTLVSFPASVAAGVYTFDVQFKHGLTIEIPSGTIATGTITHRP